MKAHVVMLLSNALRSDPRVEKESAALIGAGYDVTVVAWNRGGDLPAEESRGDLRIVRVGPRAAHGGGLKNIPAYREFYANAVRVAAGLSPDVVHCHDLDTALAGLSLTRSRPALRPSLVMDMHELYRESNMIPQRGFKGRVARLFVRLVEARAYAKADAILVANPGTTAYYEALGYGDKVVLVENAPDLDLFAPTPRASNARFTVGYFGQKRYVEGLRHLIDVVGSHDEIEAILAGGGVAEAEIENLAAGVDGVEVSGEFAYADLPALYQRVDAVHAVYDTTLGNVRTLFPVKAMEAMACALPVLVAADTWIGSYAEANGIGIAVPSGDRVALDAAVLRLASDPCERYAMGQAGRHIVEAGLSWQAACKRLVDTYAEMLGVSRG